MKTPLEALRDLVDSATANVHEEAPSGCYVVDDNAVQVARQVLASSQGEPESRDHNDLLTDAMNAMREAYNAHVTDLAKGLAKEIREGDHGEGEDCRERLHEVLHETCDGDHWVIWTNKAKAVCLVSTNSGASIDNFGTDGVVKDGDINWSSLAYGALEADLIEALGNEDIDVNDPNPESEEDDEPEEEMPALMAETGEE